MCIRGIGLALTLSIVLAACSLVANSPPDGWLFKELPTDLIPPCLSHGEMEGVISSREDYERLRRVHALQGDYVDFTADGVRISFELPYQPLDANQDGQLGANDMVIYIHGGPLLTRGGEDFTQTRPIHVRGDSILIFRTSRPFVLDRKIHHAEVFTVDPVNGRVTFANPPQSGSTVSISAEARLYDRYNGRDCEMESFDFAETVIIGKSITGDGSLQRLVYSLYLDEENRKLIYQWRRVELPGGDDIPVQITKWIAADRPPQGYDIEFVELK